MQSERINIMTEAEIKAFDEDILKSCQLTVEEKYCYMASTEYNAQKQAHKALHDQALSRSFNWNAEGLDSTKYNNMLAFLFSWGRAPVYVDGDGDEWWADYKFEDISPSKISDCALKSMLYAYADQSYRDKAINVVKVLNLISARISDVRHLEVEEKVGLLETIIYDLNHFKKSIPTWLLGEFLSAIKEDTGLDASTTSFQSVLHLPVILTRIKLFFSGYFSEAFSPYLSSAPAEAADNAWVDDPELPPAENELSIWLRIKNFFASLFNRKGNQYLLQGKQRPALPEQFRGSNDFLGKNPQFPVRYTQTYEDILGENRHGNQG